MTDRANPIAVRILVLDDEPVMLELLSCMLSNLGLSDVTACDTGLRALELLDGSLKSTDLILLDLDMPGMDGIEFLRELHERRYTGSVLLTSGADEQILQSAETLIRAHSIRALGHLQKPVQPDALAAMLASWRPAMRATSRKANKTYAAEELRRAITNRELVNYYQPKVTLAAGKVVGVETLVRWRHPVDGLVFPDQFIGVAEANGLIDDLTHVVIGEALAQTRLWLDAGLALHTAVNVSMDNLTSLSFPDIVSERATAAGVPAENLVLEITESRLMANLVTTLDVLTRLRMKHFRLSIDDFGTGHSSLAQLRDIPFDELKIDRSFVHGATVNNKKRAICDASLGLARQLGIFVTAEGVEDQDDWRYLRGAGCDFAQGYFVAKPMPGAELSGWIDEWAVRVCAGI
jgi:EAL domain-containing protein (putative c-di-GMP-specific phosphodiesterase class I)/CheY-like chemotaxis protein